MKKLANRVTRYLFGVDCYPESINDTYTPTFKTVVPDGYDPNNCICFNNWAESIHMSLKTK